MPQSQILANQNFDHILDVFIASNISFCTWYSSIFYAVYTLNFFHETVCTFSFQHDQHEWRIWIFNFFFRSHFFGYAKATQELRLKMKNVSNTQSISVSEIFHSIRSQSKNRIKERRRVKKTTSVDKSVFQQSFGQE